ncbi:transglycosylase SLT domain-containing protein [Tropicimonas sp. IMCC34011]|uniref:transglycosylase SLT domain-containing protein n=1 Tax=Tropicimonas sp. IMCC34011 TaxID=2248759 RepID=UPI000E2725AE|nr:transglycosylase SLT domain-containing protein [Tropicimonas sp. IMCC34011]
MTRVFRALRALAIAAVPLFALSACDAVQANRSVEATRGLQAPSTLPVMRWDHRPEGKTWTMTALTALEDHGAVLPNIIPGDIEQWCPAYVDATEEQRKAFWTGLLSALAKHESTWNPAAVGGGGKWFGLVQISPATARSYGCSAGSGSALKNGEANLSCAIRIMARTVKRDGVISAGMRGVAADWGPFHSSRKRSDMMQWTRSQPFCRDADVKAGL